MVAHKAACHTIYVECFSEIYEEMVQILLILKLLFTQDSEVEDVFCGASPGSEPSMFFSNNPFSLGFEPVQDDFQCTFTWLYVTDEADGSLVVVRVRALSQSKSLALS